MLTLLGVLTDLLDRQSGVLTRSQALAAGLTRAAINANLAAGRWRRLFPGIYVTFTGPVAHEAWLWAAVLHAGDGAALSHRTAAELSGMVDPPPGDVRSTIHVTIPGSRRVVAPPGLVVHHSARARAAVHPTRLPPRTRIEETIVDLVQAAGTLEEAVGWVTGACARRLTKPERIRAAMTARKELRWRHELADVLREVADGCHSVLERRYLRDVERAHGLPIGRRQALRVTDRGNRYDDVRYDDYDVSVELDGRMAHPDHARWRDMRRDNSCVVAGDRVLRFGWVDVAPRPCAVAVQVVALLRGAGWRGKPRPCRRPDCVIVRAKAGRRRTDLSGSRGRGGG